MSGEDERRARSVPAGSSGNDRQGMAASGLYRLWRTPDPHRIAPSPVRRGAGVDRGEGVRGRHRHDEPPTRPRFDPAGDLLRLAPTGTGRRLPRRSVLHRARARAHPGPLRGLSGQPSTRLDPGRGGRGRRRCAGSGAERGVGARPGQLETDRHETRREGPLGRVRTGWRCRRGHGRPVLGARATCVRRDRDHGAPSG